MPGPDQDVYTIHFEDEAFPSQTIQEGESIDIGSDKKNNVTIDSFNLEKDHCILYVKKGVLSLKNLAPKGQTIYRDKPLLKDKNYILNDQDKVKLAKITLLIRKKQNGGDETHQEDHIEPPFKSLMSKKGSASSMDLTGTVEINSYKDENDNTEKENKFDEFQLDNEDRRDDLSLDNLSTHSVQTENIATKEEEKGGKEDEQKNQQDRTNSIHDGFNLSDLNISIEGQNDSSKKPQESESIIKKGQTKVDTIIKNILNQAKNNKGIKKILDAPTIIAKKNKINKKNKKNKKKLFIDGPPFIWRAYAQIVDLSLVYLFYYYFLPTIKLKIDVYNLYSHYLKQKIILLHPHIYQWAKINWKEKLIPLFSYTDKWMKVPWAQSLILAVLIYCAMNLIFNILLGNSFALKMTTQQRRSHFIFIRIKAFIKSLINIITLPFIIFHLPLLFGKRPFSEWILGIPIEKKQGIVPLLMHSLIFPLIIFVCLHFGLLFFQPNKIIFSPEKENLLNESQTSPITQVNSHYFKIKDLQVSSESIAITPRIQITGQKPRFEIQFSHLKNMTHTYLGRKTLQVHFLELIKVAKRDNPLFDLFYPNLKKSLQEKKIGRDKETQEEIKKLIQTSLSLSINNIPKLLLNGGFFSLGFFKFKTQFLEQLDLDYLPRARFIEISNKDFLQMTPAKRKSDKWGHFLPIGSGLEKSPIYYLRYNSKSKAFSNTILFRYLGLGTWNFEKRDQMAPPTKNDFESKKIGQYNAFTIIDLFHSLDGSFTMTKKLATKIYNYYYYLTNKKMTENLTLFKPILKEILTEVINYCQYLNKKGPSPFFKLLNGKIKELQGVVDSENRDFFKGD